MAKPLTGCWIVNGLRFVGDIAHITIARNKTVAKQKADGLLAYAYCDWEKSLKSYAETEIRLSEGRYKTIDELVTAIRKNGLNFTGSTSIDKYQRWFAEGIQIKSVDTGEVLVIKEPTKKALTKQARLTHQSEAFANNMLKVLTNSLKP